MTRDEILRAMQRRRMKLSSNLSIYDYLDGCIQAMFEAAADVLSEHQSGASQHTGGQPKAGGLQNRECLGVMDDPEMKGD
jgi:hypothetical protein